MFRTVEVYGTDESVTLNGRTQAVPALIEDDETGLRWLLLASSSPLRAQTWVRAASGGCAALMALGERVEALTAERWAETRRDLPDGTMISDKWITFDEIPSYVDVKDYVVETADTFGFVNLHNHSENSALDGLSTPAEMVQAALDYGQGAIGVTDHGNGAVHPEFYRRATEAGIKPILGIEAYFVDDRLARPNAEDPEIKQQQVKDLKDYFHVCLWAMNDVGLKNLWAASTESYRDGFYYKPRMDWDTLSRFNEGIIASTGCLRGPLSHGALMEGNEQLARTRLGRLLDIFDDRLYIEMHCNQLEEQIALNHHLVKLAREFNVPMIAAADSHYAKEEDRKAHRAWLSIQTNKDISDEGTLFAGGQDYHLLTETEVRGALEYLGTDVVDEAIANTGRIAAMCNVEIKGSSHTPTFSKSGGAERDEERLLELCLSNWHKTRGKKYGEEVYIERFEREFGLLSRRSFCGYYLMVSDYCTWARENGILVGPGRGSGAGSLVAYLANITDVDPVDADILFERFLNEGRKGLPDFDVDFPASRKQEMQQYVTDKYGADSVVVVGSILRLKNKGIVKDLGRVLRSELPPEAFKDLEEVAKIIDDAEADTAGLGKSWEQLWDQHGDQLDGYRRKYPELFSLADKLVGRVKTYGQHAAGVVITTEGKLVDQLPLRRAGDEGFLITQFDKDVLEELGFVKFDILTVRTLDTIQDTIKLIKERHGTDIDVYSWTEEYLDPQVWDEISQGNTLGMFQTETTSGMKMCKRVKPQSMADLSDVVTLVRPGPQRSGLTDTYIRRRDGEEPVSFPDPRLEDVLARTHGVILYQEDIMSTCMALAGYTATEADGIRKILGKKKVEQAAIAGKEFVERCVNSGFPLEEAEHLWGQMAEFSKYAFGRAHAYGYAILSYWTAWLKTHYPLEFLTACLSTVNQDRIPEFIKEARRLGVQILPPDINKSGIGFSIDGVSIRYGLNSIKGIGNAAHSIIENQPFTSWDDFMERKGTANMGQVATLAHIGAFDSLISNRHGLEVMLQGKKDGTDSDCFFKNIAVKGPNGLPCTFDWSSEPIPVNPRTGKNLKPKPLPKKCTKACRNYTAPPPMDIDSVTPYTDKEIREIEMETLGVYLSSTPFDDVEAGLREKYYQNAGYMRDEPVGSYEICGILLGVRTHRDRSGRQMAFLDVETEISSERITVFSDAWMANQSFLKQGALVVMRVEKNSRGITLKRVIIDVI